MSSNSDKRKLNTLEQSNQRYEKGTLSSECNLWFKLRSIKYTKKYIIGIFDDKCVRNFGPVSDAFNYENKRLKSSIKWCKK